MLHSTANQFACAKLAFLHENYDKILEVETLLQNILPRAESTSEETKASEASNWFGFQDAFKIQTSFTKEQEFLKSLNFIRRVELKQ